MKAMFLLYGIADFLEVPDPPPPYYKRIVPMPPTIGNKDDILNTPPLTHIVEFRTSKFYFDGKQQIPIYEPYET